MVFYRFFILGIIASWGLVSRSEVMPNSVPDLHCFNSQFTTSQFADASLDINQQIFKIEVQMLAEGRPQLEEQYTKIMELKTSSDLAINRTALWLDARGVNCVRTGRGNFDCIGKSRSATLQVGGNYTKDNTQATMGLRTEVILESMTATVRSVPDLMSDTIRNKIVVEVNADVVFLDGKKISLRWAPIFSDSDDPTQSSYCVGQ